jgi:DNA-directed RNA polymerase specialized sigma24 family protein
MEGFKKFLEQSLSESLTRPDFQVLNLYLHKEKISEISQITGKSIGEIYRTLKRYDIPPNRLKIHHDHVLNLSGGGFSMSEISALTGYSKKSVRTILTRLHEG